MGFPGEGLRKKYGFRNAVLSPDPATANVISV